MVCRTSRHSAGRAVQGSARPVQGGHPAARGRAMNGMAGQIVAILFWLLAAHAARAHEVRPAYLELREGPVNEFQMTWKVPALGEFRLSMAPRLPGFCRTVGTPVSLQMSGAAVEHSRVACTSS